MAETETPEKTSSTQREISVEIPVEVVNRETEAVIQKFQKMARLPGFRKGKVPATVVRQRFAEDIKTEVVEQLVPRYFREETEKQGLHPVSQPRVTDLHLHEGEPLKFKAKFEVLPDFEVQGYHEIKIEKPNVSVTDEEVEKTLNHLREQNASYNPVEGRPIQDGDFASVAFKGTPQGEAEGQPVTMDDVMVEVGGSNTIPEFSENLRGANAGDERTFVVKYADDFSDQRLAGKSFDYWVKVNGIKTKSMPELSDDFAKELGAEFTSIDDVRKRIREGMESEKQHQAEHESKDKLVEELLSRNPIDVPEALVEHQIDLRLERGLRALAQQGMKTEDMRKMDFARLRAGQRDAAKKEVQVALLLEKIADKENIEVTDEDVEKEVQILAAQSQQAVEALRQKLIKDGTIDRMRNRIRTDKAMDLVYNRATQ
ncbi:MAG TPA: trigger factor [Terriglobales bacterium]|nr:trigger factor [Terriglobales bacterium]